MFCGAYWMAAEADDVCSSSLATALVVRCKQLAVVGVVFFCDRPKIELRCFFVRGAVFA